MKRLIFEPEHEQFRDTVRAFISREIEPHAQEWEAAGQVDRDIYRKAGEAGLVGFNVAEEFGGGGVDDFRFNVVVAEEMARASHAGPAFTLQNDVVVPYFTSLSNDEQRTRWLRGMATGETIVAVAMTEPGAGSDLAGIKTSAVRDGDDWVLNGSKTFISSGINSDLVVVVCRTNPDPAAKHKAFSLLVVERGMAGFERGRKLDKMGLKSQDTAELHFDNVRVPAANVLGQVDQGFYHLMHNLPSERLSIAVTATAIARSVYEETLQYCKDRKAFGKPIGTFQANRFTLAEMATELDVAEAYIDRCIQGVLDGEASAVDASKAKWWGTELSKRVVDSCLQLHGGYGYLRDYPLERIVRDLRVHQILEGTNEIMRVIIAREMLRG